MSGSGGWTWRHRAAPYLFLAPSAALFATFLAYPLVRSAVLSFYKSAGPDHEVFVGMANYAFLLRDRYFWWAVANTVLFTVGFVALELPLALGLALLLNHRRVGLKNFFRLAFFSTYLVGQVFVAVIFALLLGGRQGLVNRLLMDGGVIGEPVGFLTDPRWSMVSMWVAALWLMSGYGMIYLLAALQGVDQRLYEAAAVDGASGWGRLVHVTLPGIRHVLWFLVLVGAIGGLQLFELPYVLFGGSGPNSAGLTVVMYLFITGFEVGDLGYASAIGWALVAMIGVLAALYLRSTGLLREERR
jgi:ABC-type sugar transport system permease subunit